MRVQRQGERSDPLFDLAIESKLRDDDLGKIESPPIALSMNMTRLKRDRGAQMASVDGVGSTQNSSRNIAWRAITTARVGHARHIPTRANGYVQTQGRTPA